MYSLTNENPLHSSDYPTGRTLLFYEANLVRNRVTSDPGPLIGNYWKFQSLSRLIVLSDLPFPVCLSAPICLVFVGSNKVGFHLLKG